jgi:hypothetical protein
MRITRRKIEQEILNRFGLTVELVKGNGYYYFSTDHDESAEVLYQLPTTSVYTMFLNGGNITIEWWVGYFEDFLIDGGYLDPNEYEREQERG